MPRIGSRTSPAPSVVHVVARRLPAERAAHRVREAASSAPPATGPATGPAPAAEARLEPAVGGDPGAVAVLAEVLGHRADEADEPLAPARSRAAHVARRSPAAPARPARARSPSASRRARTSASGTGRAAREGHLLDEARERAAVPGVAHERAELVLVHAAHHDGVHLERAEAAGGRVDAGEDPLEPRARARRRRASRAGSSVSSETLSAPSPAARSGATARRAGGRSS